MRIIPAIDIMDGKCVRLTQGDYAMKKVYSENPLEIAREFEASGVKYLHLVDLDGARAGKVINWKVIEALAGKTALEIDFGGGIKTDEEIAALFTAGVRQVNLGSIAVKDKPTVDRWISEYGREKIIISADVTNEKIAVAGWTEDSGILITDFLSGYITTGIEFVTCTDISTDGTLKGPNLALYRKLKKHFPALKIVASGGVGKPGDLEDLERTGVDGVIIGKALYEGKISLNELTKFMRTKSC